MEERADVPYLERRNPQLFLELTPKRGLGAFPRLDVATRKGDGAWHHPLCGLPLLREDRRLLEDEGRDTLKRLSVLPHAAPPLLSCCRTFAVSGRGERIRARGPLHCGLGLAADLSIDVAIARLRRNVGMDDPPTKNALPRHAELLEDSCRGCVVDIAKRPDSIDPRKIGSPRYDSLARLSSVAMMPIGASQRIPDIHRVPASSAGD